MKPEEWNWPFRERWCGRRHSSATFKAPRATPLRIELSVPKGHLSPRIHRRAPRWRIFWQFRPVSGMSHEFGPDVNSARRETDAARRTEGGNLHRHTVRQLPPLRVVDRLEPLDHRTFQLLGDPLIAAAVEAHHVRFREHQLTGMADRVFGQANHVVPFKPFTQTRAGVTDVQHPFPRRDRVHARIQFPNIRAVNQRADAPGAAVEDCPTAHLDDLVAPL